MLIIYCVATHWCRRPSSPVACCHALVPSPAVQRRRAPCRGAMPANVDRPTILNDTLEEGHPGTDTLKLEHTARNRIKRTVKQDRTRNLWLQRLYDGTFFIVWHAGEATKWVARRTIAVKCPPINPYSGGELSHLAVRDLLVEMSHAACTVNNAICDAICAVCESPTDPPLTVEDQPTHARPIPPIGTPIMPSN